MELEENTREPETFFKQQAYINSFYLEGVLDEIIFQINYNSQNNIKNDLFVYINKNKNFGPISLKNILFSRTNYLLHYRGLMVDLSLERFMF